jgi:hypothetical protein
MRALKKDPRDPVDDYLDSFPKKPGLSPAIPYILIACTPLGVCIVLGGASFILTWRAQLWVKTPCIVVFATPVSYSVPAGKNSSFYFYGAALTYSYQFCGSRYTADRYSPSYSYDRLSGATEAVAKGKYPIGQMLTCYVNPRNPSEAVIDRNFTNAQIWAMMLIPPFFFIVGIYSPISIMRKAKARTER